MIIGTFILDFQTTDYPSDSIIAVDVLSQYQKACGLENQFALDAPVQSAALLAS
jgi:hypothetical protein